MSTSLLEVGLLEPRNLFPVVKAADLVVCFHNPTGSFTSWRGFVNTIRYAYRHAGLLGGTSYVIWAVLRFLGLGGSVKVSYVLLKDGEAIHCGRNLLRVRKGESGELSSAAILSDAGLENCGDFTLLVSLSRGVDVSHTGFGSGTLSVNYKNSDRSICMYRNGLFARPVNDFTHHKPKGFRSIFPFFWDKTQESSFVLVNYSTDKNYRSKASVSVAMHARSNKKIIGKSIEVKAQCFVEVEIGECFNLDDISGGSGGFIILEAPGVTLSSIHVIRSSSTGQLLAVEHSRPTHAYVI